MGKRKIHHPENMYTVIRHCDLTREQEEVLGKVLGSWSIRRARNVTVIENAAPTGGQAGEVSDVMVEAALQAYVSESGTVDTRGDDLLPIDHEGMRAALTTALAKPLPVGVPDELPKDAVIFGDDDDDGYRMGWNACRKAMLAARGGVMPNGPLTGKYADVLVPFVALMEHELHANAGKGDRPGWLSMSPETAVLEVHHHVAKLQKAVLSRDADGVREYAADVANMSMMAVDVCGALIDAAPDAEVQP